MENIQVDTKDTVEIDSIKLHKMVFIYNALENGWTINKRKTFIFLIKKHEGKKEVLLDNYLRRFMVNNFDINNV